MKEKEDLSFYCDEPIAPELGFKDGLSKALGRFWFGVALQNENVAREQD